MIYVKHRNILPDQSLFQNQIREIFNEEEVYGDIDDIFFDSFEERYLDMPCAGTRVRRGRHWNYENQDGYGVGTVIGHCKRGVAIYLYVINLISQLVLYIYIRQQVFFI